MVKEREKRRTRERMRMIKTRIKERKCAWTGRVNGDERRKEREIKQYEAKKENYDWKAKEK